MTSSYSRHINVRWQDVFLQVIQFGGRFFVERALTFGASSSPSIYDRMAEMVLMLVAAASEVPRHCLLRQLDDNMAVGSLPMVARWYDTYHNIAKEIGVRTAPEDVPDKCFGPAPSGILLGIEYDLPSWRWRMPADKADKLLRLLFSIRDATTVSNGLILTTCGKITHYHSILGDCGKYERSFLIQSSMPLDDKTIPIQVTANMRSQADYWIRTLAWAQDWSPIPDPRPRSPASSFHAFPDAAGGSQYHSLNGYGAVFLGPQLVVYTCSAWPPAIQFNHTLSCQLRAGNKLMFLESVAALAALITAAPYIRNRGLIIHTDNKALTYAWASGHSACPLTCSITTAMHRLARALCCSLDIEWVRRCSSDAATVADLLSKGNTTQALTMMGPAAQLGYCSRTLSSYLQDPFPTRLLGQAIIKELHYQDNSSVLLWEVESDTEVDKLVKLPVEMLWKTK